jgi:hypothetical protein
MIPFADDGGFRDLAVTSHLHPGTAFLGHGHTRLDSEHIL